MIEELFSTNMKSNKLPSGGPIHLRSFSLDTETVFIEFRGQFLKHLSTKYTKGENKEKRKT